jgi:hypothetical protein
LSDQPNGIIVINWEYPLLQGRNFFKAGKLLNIVINTSSIGEDNAGLSIERIKFCCCLKCISFVGISILDIRRVLEIFREE